MAKKELKDKIEKPSLKKALAGIVDKYGKEGVNLVEGGSYVKIDRLPTGIKELDLALGGGIPQRRIIEIFGNESVGKSSLVQHIMAKVQQQNLKAVYVDFENSFDPEFATLLGIKLGDLYLAQPSSGEEGLTIVEDLVASGEIGIIVVDSVARICTQAEIDAELQDANISATARLMSKHMRRFVSILSKSRTPTIAIYINQNREKPGVMYGSPVYQPGGKALRFYASIRIELFRKEILEDSDKNAKGIKIRAKVVKNKTAPPFRECMFDFLYDTGFKVT